jgi:hypothetical protein
LLHVSVPAPPVFCAPAIARLTVTADPRRGIAQRVQPARAVERVVAGAAFDDVGIAIAGQCVVEARTGQILNAVVAVGSRDAGIDAAIAAAGQTIVTPPLTMSA